MTATQPKPTELFSRDWREQIAIVVSEECQNRNFARDALTRDDRRILVQVLDEKGLFDTRQAAEHAAKALRVSRATIYQLLKDVRAPSSV